MAAVETLMPKAAPIITNFNAGEWSPLMMGRVDNKWYPNACRRMRNFIPLRQGPARRRAGTRFVAEVKDSAARTWLGRFIFNVEQAYVLEFGDKYIRFFADHGVVESGGSPLEVATPYTTADLQTNDGTFALRFAQSNDVLYITHPRHAPRKLTRTGAATFTLDKVEFTGGPFLDIDPDQTVTVYASANTGTGITITASSAIFDASHVGSKIYIEQKNTDNIKQWEAGKTVTANDVRKSDGKNYTALNSGTTGTIRPTHTRGAKFDGDGGVQWEFNDPGYGWATITAVGGGGTTATANVDSRIPDMAVGPSNATTRWAFSAWSDAEGWPDNVTFWRERLIFSKGRKIYGSVAGSFEDMRRKDDGGLVTKEMAFIIDTTTDQANDIAWMAPTDKALLSGTAADESAVSELTGTEAFGPGNTNNRKQTEFGARRLPTVRVGDVVIFGQRQGRKLRAMQYNWEKEGFIAPDLTLFAEHVTKGGIIDLAFQQEPNSVVWGVREDGALLGLTLDPEQEVRGWHPHRIGGYSDADKMKFAAVEAITTIPAPDNDRHELWMIVRRYINGGVKRYVEWMEYDHEEGDDPDDAFYVDCGLTFDGSVAQTLTPGAGATVKGTEGVSFTAGGAAFAPTDVGRRIHYRYSTVAVTGKRTWHRAVAVITAYTSATEVTGTILSAFPNTSTIAASEWALTATTISGLNHLEGESVQVRVNGANHPNRIVSGGQISLQGVGGSVVHVGLACPAAIQPTPIEAGSADGTAQGKTQRISRVGIMFHETDGSVQYGRDEDKQLDRIELRSGSTAMDEPPPLFTGIKTVAWPDGYGADGEPFALITIIADQPGPCTIVALMPQIKTEDNR